MRANLLLDSRGSLPIVVRVVGPHLIRVRVRVRVRVRCRRAPPG